jgi:hypothetical protein
MCFTTLTREKITQMKILHDTLSFLTSAKIWRTPFTKTTTTTMSREREITAGCFNPKFMFTPE